MSDRPYSRIYWEVIREFPELAKDCELMGAFSLLLIGADMAWDGTEARPFLPRHISDTVLARLVKIGLVTVKGPSYSIRGHSKERAGRSAHAAKASNARWNARSNAPSNARAFGQGKPRRDETSKDKTSTSSARHGLPNITPRVQEEGESITGAGLLTAGEKQLTELDRLCGAHDEDKVLGALQAVAQGQRKSWRQLVWDSMKALEPLASSKDTREAEVEVVDAGRWRKAQAHIESLRRGQEA